MTHVRFLQLVFFAQPSHLGIALAEGFFVPLFSRLAFQALVRPLLIMVAVAGMWGTGGEAKAAALCLENGGNYVGCVQPIGFQWKSEDGTYHSDRMGAIQASVRFAIDSMDHPELYNLGLQSGPYNYSSFNSNCQPIFPNTDNSYTDLSAYNTVGTYSNTRITYYTHYYGRKPHPSCQGQFQYTSWSRGSTEGSPICPAGYRISLETTPLGPPYYGFMCVPGDGNETTLAQVTEPKELSCQDTVGKAGQASTSMPVNIATRCKTEAQRDLQTNGPWPIGWDRYMAQDSEREGWVMGVTGTIATATRSDGKTWAVLRRPWGQFLAFNAVPVSNGPRTWTSGMKAAKLFQSRLQDVWNGGKLTSWVLWQADGVVETYDASGRLLRRRSADGFQHHYSFDSQNRLSSIRDDFGHAVTVSYLQNAFGQTGTYTWEDENGNPVSQQSAYTTSWADPLLQALPDMVSDGTRTVGYGWTLSANNNAQTDFNARLNLVSWNDGSEQTYVYGESVNGKTPRFFMMSGVVDEEGRRLRTYEPVSNNSPLVLREWKAAGPDGVGALERLTINTSSLVDQDGRTFSFTKGTSGTQSDTRIRAYSTPCPECGGTQGSALTYDSNGFLTQIKDWRNVTTVLTYDDAGRITSVTEASGTALARTTTSTYPTDPALRDPLTVTEPVMTAAGTAALRTTTYTYTDVPVTYVAPSPCAAAPVVPCPSTVRKLTQVTVSVNDGSTARTTTIAYNARGLRETLTTPDGLVTRWTWTADGQVASLTVGHGTAAAQTRTFGGHGPWGPTWQQDPNGLVTRWTFDARGRVTKEEVGLPGAGGIGSVDANGQWNSSEGTWQTTVLTWRVNGLLDATQGPDGTRKEFAYDGANKPILVTARTTTGAVMWTQAMTWSPAGLLESTTTRDANGQVVLTSGQTYTALQQLATVVDSRNQSTVLGYNANGEATSTKTPLGYTSSQELDLLGRPTTFTDALNQAAQVTYGPSDEIRTATDQRGVLTKYFYNGFGDLVRLESPDRGTWVIQRDAAGRETQRTDPRGVVVTTTYDALSRPSTVTYSTTGVTGAPAGLTLGTVTHTFTYDSCTLGQGRLCQVVDASGTTAYVYNAWGAVAGKAWTGKAGGPAAGVTLTTGYGYDVAKGRLTTVTYPSGKTLNVAYGTDGRPSGLSYAGQMVVANVTWTANDDVAGWAWPQATGWSGTHSAVQFTYDTDGQPVRIQDLDDRSLVWDNDSRLVGVDDATNAAASQLYGYDPLSRLTSSDIGAWNGAVSFAYDAAGNRTSLTDGNTGNSWQYTYGLTNNRQVSQASMVGGSTGTPLPSTYDAMGNLVTDGIGLQLSYDATGRLVQGSKGPQGMTAAYNALGQRMVKASGSEVRVYAVDEAGRPLGVYVVDAAQPNGYRVEEEYVHLDGWRPVAVVRPDATTGMANPQIFPILTDHLGTPRKVLDGNTGDTRWSWDAKQPFGHEMPNETPTASQAAFAFDLRFPGQRYDEETGLFHNGFRDYHSGLGRYVQSDPLGLEAGWNTYGYAGANPGAKIDPVGLSEQDIKRIRKITDTYVVGAVARGERSALFGFRSGRINSSYNNLAGYNVCTQQATALLTILGASVEKGEFDDNWKFRLISSYTHTWVEGRSDNPNDPILKVDPWVNDVGPYRTPIEVGIGGQLSILLELIYMNRKPWGQGFED